MSEARAPDGPADGGPPTQQVPLVPPTADEPLVAGLLLAGRYRLVRPLASGGMASVWEGHDEVLTRPVAIKIPHPHLATDAAFRERFRREAIAAARLGHPSIVSTFDTGTDGRHTFIVMELVAGRTLKDALAALGPLPPAVAVGIAVQVADALDAAHRGGLIHRDVKPANILLVEDGRSAVPRVKVADFGVARAVQAAEGETDLTNEGQVIGTAKYLAPEQVDARPLDARTDVYALGVVLHELLAGAPPFVRTTDVSTALAQLQDPPPPLRTLVPGTPPALEALVLACLAKDPDQRPPSAADLAAHLRTVLVDADAGRSGPADRTVAMSPAAGPGAAATVALDQPARPAPTAAPARRKVPGRSRTPAVIVGCVIAAAVVTTVLVLSRTGGGPTVGATTGTTGRPVTTTTTTAAAAPALSYATFDPQGGGGENDNLLVNLDDDDPSTVWTTERYNSPVLQPLKDGVGVVVDLGRARPVRTVVAQSRTSGWSARIYVATDDGQRSIDDWGSAQASLSAIKVPVARFVLDAAPTARYVLLWITVTGTTDGSNRTEIGDLRAPEATARRDGTLGADDDRDLVRAAQQGDRRALEDLLRRHQPRLHAVCRRMLGNDADAADACQDALVSVVRGLATFDGGARFSTWAYRVAVNASLDELRRRNRRPLPGFPDDEDGGPFDGAGPGPRGQGDTAGMVADRLDVDAALRRLPPDYRAAVVLRDLCQLDYAEIGEVLGIPAGTVRSRISRGRAALAPLLAGNQDPPAARPTGAP